MENNYKIRNLIIKIQFNKLHVNLQKQTLNKSYLIKELLYFILLLKVVYSRISTYYAVNTVKIKQNFK